MTTTKSATPATITEHEANEVERANATGLQPIVFVHGLWLLPSSWDRWGRLVQLEVARLLSHPLDPLPMYRL
jgi:hypothetical protein